MKGLAMLQRTLAERWRSRACRDPVDSPLEGAVRVGDHAHVTGAPTRTRVRSISKMSAITQTLFDVADGEQLDRVAARVLAGTPRRRA